MYSVLVRLCWRQSTATVTITPTHALMLASEDQAWESLLCPEAQEPTRTPVECAQSKIASWLPIHSLMLRQLESVQAEEVTFLYVDFGHVCCGLLVAGLVQRRREGWRMDKERKQLLGSSRNRSSSRTAAGKARSLVCEQRTMKMCGSV